MSSGHKVLLVDDDPLVLAGFKEILARAGYVVTPVFSGREALEKIEAESFDVILTDLLMPRVSGLDVVRFAAEKNSDAVVIVVTGYASVRSAVEALRLGAHDYLIKPCDEHELLFRVKMGIERTQLRRELRTKELDAEKMQAIAQTAVTVNDQINTPLNVILNSIELIRLKLMAGSDEVDQPLDFIGQEVGKIKTVIQRLAKIVDPKIKEYSSGSIYMVDVDGSDSKVARPQAAAPNKIRILVVDDEQFMVHTLAKILETLGYDVVCAFGGREAYRVCLAEKVDLVVSDLHMPDMSGLELLTSIKTHDPLIPVILVTGYGIDRAKESAGKWKADGFLGKPFRITELQSLIETTLAAPPSGSSRAADSMSIAVSSRGIA
ncbi:MAG TPA: response regulator [bacterium]|jgi:DNA-binding NtrC family response regulator